MKRFACGDVVPNCRATWVCSSEDEIMARVAEHASQDHGLASIPPELADAVRATIRSD